MKPAAKIMILFLLLQLAFVALMLSAFVLPEKRIEKNADKFLYALNREGDYPKSVFKDASGVLDNFTEKMMLNNAKATTGNVLKDSMIPGYSRYWHGYVAFLRPMLLVFNYDIRHLYVAVFFPLLFFALILIRDKINAFAALSLLVSTILTSITSVSSSMQFAHVYLVMFASIIVLLAKNRLFLANHTAFLMAFLTIGAVTNFVDFLTAPLITLGVPLALFYVVAIRNRQEPHAPVLRYIILPSAVWGIGYAGTWISKWALSTLILRKNVFANALQQGTLRVGGSEEFPLRRLEMLTTNLYQTWATKPAVLLLAVFTIVLLYFAVKSGCRKSKIVQNLPLVLVAFYPLAWYNVFANHSQIHHWFTFRMMMVAFFPLFLLLSNLIGQKKICKTRSEHQIPHS